MYFTDLFSNENSHISNDGSYPNDKAKIVFHNFQKILAIVFKATGQLPFNYHMKAYS